MNSNPQAQTILEKIIIQRRLDVAEAKTRRSLDDLKANLNAYPLINFYQRLQGNFLKWIFWVKFLTLIRRAHVNYG